MAIRVRKVQGELVALCAAKTKPQSDDLYLDDSIHHALMNKFCLDLESEGFLKRDLVRNNVRKLTLELETT